MIWSGGAILADDALSVPISDRAFEHGLGLFETLRTWDGRPSLIDRHRSRMLRSARELGLTIDPSELPEADDVARLIRAEGSGGDRMLRITATGGIGPGRSTVWMRSGPLPSPTRPGGAIVQIGGWEVAASDPVARHKSLNYWSRRLAAERARAAGSDEALGESGGRLWEGSRTNLFMIRDGELLTPSLLGPIVPGVMRSLVLEVAAEASIPIREVEGIAIDELCSADEVFLTNALRGIVPVGSARPDAAGSGRLPERAWPVPGPLTRVLSDRTLGRLREGEPIR